MNKETRTFIWGFIILISCGFATAGFILKLFDGHREWFNFVGLALTAPNVFVGLNKINKVTD